MLSARPSHQASFIEPCLPRSAKQPPAGPDWIHEIKHDGFRMMVRRDAAGVRLLTRNGIDWTTRFPAIADQARCVGASCSLHASATDFNPSVPSVRAANTKTRPDCPRLLTSSRPSSRQPSTTTVERTSSGKTDFDRRDRVLPLAPARVLQGAEG